MSADVARTCDPDLIPMRHDMFDDATELAQTIRLTKDKAVRTMGITKGRRTDSSSISSNWSTKFSQ